jgi:hypothetical protein
LVDLGGARSHVAVALRKDGSLLGHIGIYRQEVRPCIARTSAATTRTPRWQPSAIQQRQDGTTKKEPRLATGLPVYSRLRRGTALNFTGLAENQGQKRRLTNSSASDPIARNPPGLRRAGL